MIKLSKLVKRKKDSGDRSKAYLKSEKHLCKMCRPTVRVVGVCYLSQGLLPCQLPPPPCGTKVHRALRGACPYLEHGQAPVVVAHAVAHAAASLRSQQ